MLCRVALVRIEVSEKHISSIIRVTKMDELGTELAVTNIRSSDSCNIKRFEGAYCFHHLGDKNRQARNKIVREIESLALVRTDDSEERITIITRTLVASTVNVVPSSPILDTLAMEAIHTSETSALERVFYSHRREHLKSNSFWLISLQCYKTVTYNLMQTAANNGV
jgi:hypothetical protein